MTGKRSTALKDIHDTADLINKHCVVSQQQVSLLSKIILRCDKNKSNGCHKQSQKCNKTLTWLMHQGFACQIKLLATQPMMTHANKTKFLIVF